MRDTYMKKCAEMKREKIDINIYVTHQREMQEITWNPDALTFHDPHDCSRRTMESYSSLNEAVARADKLSFAVLPRYIPDAKAVICVLRNVWIGARYSGQIYAIES